MSTDTLTITTETLWVRHTTEQNAIDSAGRLAAKYSDQLFFVAFVPMGVYSWAVCSVSA